jgi:hypothetical protein
MWHAVG